jgi:phosphoglycolate phosphatase
MLKRLINAFQICADWRDGGAMSQIRAILFDKDGTLFDFQRSWGAWAARVIADLAAGESARASALAQALGFDPQVQRFRPESPVIAGTGDEVAELMLPHLPPQEGGLAGLSARLAVAAREVPLSEAVPLQPLFARLRGGGLRLGVATNDHEATARRHLAPHLDSLDFIAGFDSGHGGKPAPGMLLAFARHVGLAPAQVLMVGDSTHDLIAGRAAGMATMAVLTGVATADDLAPYAGAVRPDIGHLPEFLGL